RGFSQLIEQGVGLAVEHAVALLDGRLADGLSEVAFAGAGRPQKQSIFMAGNEGAGSQIKDQAAIHLLVEVEVEVVEGLLGVTELRLLAAPFQQALTTPG